MTSNFPRWEGDSTTPFVLHLAQDLQSLGWKVDVLAPHAPAAAVAETLGGVQVERFRYLWPESQQTVCYQGGALINLRKNPRNKRKLPALVGAELTAVAWRLLTRNYDALHSHWILPQGFTGMVARMLHRLPHVITVHGGDVFGLQGRILALTKRAALRSADAVTVNSSATEQAVLRLAPGMVQLHRIPMGVSTSPLDADQAHLAAAIRERYQHGGGPLLLFVGRLVEEKGVADLLHAIALLRSHVPNATALVVGEGQDRPELEALVTSLGIGEHVFFTGWVEPHQIPAYLAASDIFVGPSRRAGNGWVEAQGLTLLEAMAAGVPVIATRLGGVVDFVTHDQTGLLVADRAPAQIAQAVRRLVADAALTRQLTTHARKQVNAVFARETSAAAFSSLFERLIHHTVLAEVP